MGPNQRQCAWCMRVVDEEDAAEGPEGEDICSACAEQPKLTDPDDLVREPDE